MQINAAEARNIINTLKNGVIPDADPDILCLGRERMVKEFERCLDSSAEGGGFVKFVSGEYGSGKSFMLSKVRQLAVRRNFAVSRLQVSKSFNFSSLDILYYNIMHNLTTYLSPASGTDFESLFSHWIDGLKNNMPKEQAYNEINKTITSLSNFNSAFSRAFLTYIRARNSQDSLLANAATAWIKGEKSIPAALKAKIDVKGDIDKHTSMDSLKAFIHLLKLIGYSGLVILVDELELVMGLRSDIRKSCYENLRYIIDNTFGGDFNNCFFIFAATDELFQDSERGIRTYHALYQRIGEPIAGAASGMSDMRQPVMPLARLSNYELLLLSDRITDIHKTAFDWKPSISSEALRNWTMLTLNKEKGNSHPINTREFIKNWWKSLISLNKTPATTSSTLN